MKKTNGFYVASMAFLAGVAIGFMLSPVKNGVELGFHNCTMGSNNRTSGRWFSPKFALIENAKNRSVSKKKSGKKTGSEAELSAAEPATIEAPEVTAEPKTIKAPDVIAEPETAEV